MRKKQKSTKNPGKGRGHTKSARLCAFGFKLKPRCGAFNIRFDLTKNPMLRDVIELDMIPPYCFEYVDADIVIMDQCLICHIERGIPPDEYEKKNEAYGITRSNWEEIKPRLEAVMDRVAQKIKDERRELIREEGLSFEMPYRDNRRDC
ncbi:MAG: hypothetical protein ACLP5H_23675 [Desulfomonilaceae bacterium]